MKKMLGKRTMFLVALIMSLCMPMMAQNDIKGNALSSSTIYYLKNVGTGLHLKYGGSMGLHAAEGNAAHPIMVENKDADGNNLWPSGTWAISSIIGYLSSVNAYMDVLQGDSRWYIKEVSAGTNQYYLMNGAGLYLASCGFGGGQVDLVPFDGSDTRQRWQFIAKDQMIPAETKASALSAPIDLTPLVKGASFDLADFHSMKDRYFGKAATSSDPAVAKFQMPLYKALLSTNDFNAQKDFQYRNSWSAKNNNNQVLNGYGESGNKWWSFWPWDDVLRDMDPSIYNNAGIVENNVRAKFTFRLDIGKLPKGTYTFSFEGFSRVLYRYAGDYYSYSGAPVSVKVLSGNTSLGNTNLKENTKIQANSNWYNFIAEGLRFESNGTALSAPTNVSSDDYRARYEAADGKGQYAAKQFRDNDDWKNTITFTLSSASNVTISLERNSIDVLSPDEQNLIAFDNFTLFYHGVSPETKDPAELYYQKVKDAKDNAATKLANMTTDEPNGCTHNSVWNTESAVVDVETGKNSKIAYLNNQKIDTETEYLDALQTIEEAYQAALDAHKQKIMDSWKDGDENNADAQSPFILNNSFETGDFTGWTQQKFTDGWYDLNFGSGGEASIDGTHRLNAWTGTNNIPPITQTVRGLKNGLYKLQALIAAAPGQVVYLVANGYHAGKAAINEGTFVDAELDFLVTNNTATIGVVGAHRGYEVDGNNQHYYASGDWFKADNFRLKYICNEHAGRVRLAFREANAVELDDAGKNVLDIAKYEKSNCSDAETAQNSVNDIYSQLNAAVKAQRTRNVDMTYAINNPSFEWADVKIDGCGTWGCETGGDTGIREQSHTTYSTLGAKGRLLYNTWDVGHAKPLTQTITGIPNGTYEVSALVASTNGQSVSLIANGNSVTTVNTTGDPEGKRVTVTGIVTNNELEIKVEGASAVSGSEDKNWFKADDFRLKFLHNTLSLNETEGNGLDIDDWFTDIELLRPVKSRVWHSFVAPFDIIVPNQWDVRELTRGTIDETGVHLFLEFSRIQLDEEKGQYVMKAGTPYMVRYYPQIEGVVLDPNVLPEDLNVNEDDDEFNNDDPEGKERKYTSSAYDGKDLTEGTIFMEYQTVNSSKSPEDEAVGVSDDPDANNNNGGTLKFVGTYVEMNVPVGAIFISNNKLYVAKQNGVDGDGNPKSGTRIKPYRGYIVVDGAAKEAKSIGMRSAKTTAIDSANNGAASVVGIYNLDGMKLNEMQDGMNILQMSDGTTIKVLMK